MCRCRSSTTRRRPASDPATGLLTRDPFPGNRIPANRIDPIGQALLDLLPMPTFTDRLGGNYLANPVKTLNDYQGDLRIDHNFSNNDRVFGRLSLEKADQYLPTGLPDFGATGGFASNQTFDTDALNVALSHTHVFGSSAVNQFTAGYNRVYNYITSFGYGSNKSRELGIPGANLGTDETSSLTRMTFQNFVGIGDRGFSPFQGGTDVYHYTDTLTMVRGNHTLNTGGTFRAMQLNLLGDTALAGQFAFTPFFTSGFNAAGALNGATGYSIASLLLGLPASGGRNDQLNGSVKGRRWKEFRGFIDDTWRMSDGLTLTLGLAYMVTTPQSEAHDRFANFDFYTGETFVGGTVGVKTDWSNIQPRVGFAWTPGGAANTVLRGGYGIYHDVSAMGGSTGPYQNPPYANAYAFTSDNITPVRTLATGFPVNSQPVDPANYRGDWTTIDPDSKQGRIQQWSINVEQQLPFSTIGSVAYAGTYGDRLFDKTRNLNTATPGPGFNPAARRPYPQLQAVNAALSRGWMKYNSLQMRLERRNIDGLYLLGAYTYRQGDHQRRVGLRRRPRHRLLPGRRRRRRRRGIGQHRPAAQLHAQRALPAAVGSTRPAASPGPCSATGASTHLRGPQRLPAGHDHGEQPVRHRLRQPARPGLRRRDRRPDGATLVRHQLLRRAGGRACWATRHARRCSVRAAGTPTWRCRRGSAASSSAPRSSTCSTTRSSPCPTPSVGSPTFGQITSTVKGSRQVQLALKYIF